MTDPIPPQTPAGKGEPLSAEEEAIGQAVHELTTSINHRLAHPFADLDADCAVLGRVIASRLAAAREQAATEALDKYAETTGVGERAVALIGDLRGHGLQPGDGDRLVIVALSQAAAEARRELLAKVEGLHHPTTQDDYVAIPMVTNTVCAHCYIGVDDVHELWPCPTMALLDPSR